MYSYWVILKNDFVPLVVQHPFNKQVLFIILRKQLLFEPHLKKENKKKFKIQSPEKKFNFGQEYIISFILLLQ